MKMRPAISAALAVMLSGAAAVAGLGIGSGPASAQPPNFPDVEAFPAVDPANYEITGAAHPSGGGWHFTTPAGLSCGLSLIADLGMSCFGAMPGATEGTNQVFVSLFVPGEYRRSDPGATTDWPVLPTGTKIAPGNGIVCAALADDALACRAKKPESWPAANPNPEGKPYGEHGFVVQPSGSWTY